MLSLSCDSEMEIVWRFLSWFSYEGLAMVGLVHSISIHSRSCIISSNIPYSLDNAGKLLT